MKNITEVIFRTFNDAESREDKALIEALGGTYDPEVVALFPYEIADVWGNCMSYAFMGQHSAANYDHCIGKTRPATLEEYEALKRHLENHCGYDLKVIQKRSRKKYRTAYNTL